MMNHMIIFDLKSGQQETFFGPVPRVGEVVSLPGYPQKRVTRVLYQYGDRGLEYVLVRLVNAKKGKK